MEEGQNSRGTTVPVTFVPFGEENSSGSEATGEQAAVLCRNNERIQLVKDVVEALQGCFLLPER